MMKYITSRRCPRSLPFRFGRAPEGNYYSLSGIVGQQFVFRANCIKIVIYEFNPFYNILYKEFEKKSEKVFMEFLTSLGLTRIAWIVLGVVLIVLELVVPGAVIVFFGVGAILTGILVSLGLLEGFGNQLLFFAISSMVLVLLLRKQVAQWFPALGDYNPYNEEEDLSGRIVEVLQDVKPDSDEGQVRYQGTTWKAKSKVSVISAGQKAKITGRDNLLLYVESVSESFSESEV